MNPLFFGRAEDAQLYGIHLPPRGEARNVGVVLCYPFGQEYMRAHRAFRQLALLLSKKGHHVLRFDYRGTGDSGGDLEAVTPRDWMGDIGAAVEQLRKLADVEYIVVIGLRLGALVAGAAAAHITGIDRLILWDPIIDGAAYERELLDAIANEKPKKWGGPSSGNGELADGALWFNGFRLSRDFREALRSLALVGPAPAVPDILQIVSHEIPDFDKLREAWRTHPGYRYQFTPAPHDWNYVDNFGAILLPQPIIQSIVNSLDQQEVV